uniref:Mitochondrial genome maintenance protein MGM101 n=1 Tax=Elaeophora elaphi TaxID=1147741 RepID=A0A0R3RPM4_9BILA
MAFLKRWCFTFVDYWKTVGNDYMVVVGDLVKDAKRRPIVTAIKFLPLGGAFYAYKTNPTEGYVHLSEMRQMVLVPNSIHNKKADDEIASRTLYIDQNRLKYINCILFSVLIKLPDSNDLCLYENRASILRRWWWQRYNDIIDIGAFNKWFRLGKSFENYDINESEFDSFVSKLA